MNQHYFLAAVAVLLVGVFGGSSPADAFPTIGSIIDVTLRSAGPQIEGIHEPGRPADNYQTVYMGPYGLNAPKTDPLISFWMCFDASANIYQGQVWKVFVTNTSHAAAFYPDHGLEKLRMVAWLSTEEETTNPPTTLRNANINKAMWEILADYTGTEASLDVDGGHNGNPNNTRGTFYLTPNDPDIAAVNDWLGQAYDHRTFSTPETFLIPIQTNPDGTPKKNGDHYILDTRVQPFVTDAAVPGPSTLILLGSGLVAMVGIGLKRHCRKGELFGVVRVP